MKHGKTSVAGVHARPTSEGRQTDLSDGRTLSEPYQLSVAFPCHFPVCAMTSEDPVLLLSNLWTHLCCLKSAV
jgi:hypothetical protein